MALPVLSPKTEIMVVFLGPVAMVIFSSLSNGDELCILEPAITTWNALDKPCQALGMQRFQGHLLMRLDDVTVNHAMLSALKQLNP